jgi:hypothetical protein
MSAPKISTGENDPVGWLKSDQNGGSDTFCKVDNRFCA